MRYRRTLIAPDCSSCMISKNIIITSRRCPPQSGPGEGFTGRRFIGWQGIHRKKWKSNPSGGEGSGVANNANASVCKRELQRMFRVFFIALVNLL